MPKGQRIAPEVRERIAMLREEGHGAQDVARTLGVPASTVSAFGHYREKNTPPSAKNRILSKLTDGTVMSVRDLYKVADTDGHNIVHLLYRLGRAGFVRFDVAKAGTQDPISNIRITDAGRAFLQLAPGALVAHPIDRPRVEPLRQNEKPYVEVPVGATVVQPVGGPMEINGVPVPAGVQVRSSVDGPLDPARRPVVAERPDRLAEFPLIRALTQRKTKLAAAAKLLEEAGQPDLAAMAREQDTMSPLETEIAHYVERHP